LAGRDELVQESGRYKSRGVLRNFTGRILRNELGLGKGVEDSTKTGETWGGKKSPPACWGCNWGKKNGLKRGAACRGEACSWVKEETGGAGER